MTSVTAWMLCSIFNEAGNNIKKKWGKTLFRLAVVYQLPTLHSQRTTEACNLLTKESYISDISRKCSNDYLFLLNVVFWYISVQVYLLEWLTLCLVPDLRLVRPWCPTRMFRWFPSQEARLLRREYVKRARNTRKNSPSRYVYISLKSTKMFEDAVVSGHFVTQYEWKQFDKRSCKSFSVNYLRTFLFVIVARWEESSCCVWWRWSWEVSSLY